MNIWCGSKLTAGCSWLAGTFLSWFSFFPKQKKKKSVFVSCVCLQVRLNKAAICLPPSSSSLHLCPVVGNFMSELVIITGDCIVTFSAEIYRRKCSYICQTLGVHMWMLGVWSQSDPYICFSSLYLRLTFFQVKEKQGVCFFGRNQLRLFIRKLTVTYSAVESSFVWRMFVGSLMWWKITAETIGAN